MSWRPARYSPSPRDLLGDKRERRMRPHILIVRNRRNAFLWKLITGHNGKS